MTLDTLPFHRDRDVRLETIWVILSREINDIVDRLTPDEAEGFFALAQQTGGRYGAWVVGPGSVATVVISDNLAKTFPPASSVLIFLGCTGVFLVIARFFARPRHQRLCAFLGATAYSRQIGCRPEKLRLFRSIFG